MRQPFVQTISICGSCVHAVMAIQSALVAFALTAFVAFVQDTSASTHGNSPTNRRYLDTWSNSIYIPNRLSPLRSGYLTQWRLYARRAGYIHLQTWRHLHGYYYRLMSSTPYHIPRAGHHTVPVCPSVRVNRGDVIGFYFRGSTIPFDGHERCGPLIGYYKRHPNPASAVHVGKWFRFYPMRPGWNPCRKYSLEATIGGAVLPKYSVFGSAPLPRKTLDTWRRAIYLPRPQHRLPAGTLSGWLFYAGRAGTIHLQIWRPSRHAYYYHLVSDTKYPVRARGFHFVNPSCPVAVQRGDVIGFYFPHHSIIPFDGARCHHLKAMYVHYPRRPVTLGSHFRFAFMHYGWHPCRAYSIQAMLRR